MNLNVCEEHKNEREARGPERTEREARRSIARPRRAQTCELRADFLLYNNGPTLVNHEGPQKIDVHSFEGPTWNSPIGPVN